MERGTWRATVHGVAESQRYLIVRSTLENTRGTDSAILNNAVRARYCTGIAVIKYHKQGDLTTRYIVSWESESKALVGSVPSEAVRENCSVSFSWLLVTSGLPWLVDSCLLLGPSHHLSFACVCLCF